MRLWGSGFRYRIYRGVNVYTSKLVRGWGSDACASAYATGINHMQPNKQTTRRLNATRTACRHLWRRRSSSFTHQKPPRGAPPRIYQTNKHDGLVVPRPIDELDSYKNNRGLYNKTLETRDRLLKPCQTPVRDTAVTTATTTARFSTRTHRQDLAPGLLNDAIFIITYSTWISALWVRQRSLLSLSYT